MEVISASNTEAEIQEKTELYFDASAKEVWRCAQGGVMSFLEPGARRPMGTSRLCPQFPLKVELR